MKKNLFIILSLFAVSLWWCTTSDNQATNINPQEWEQLFNNQVESFQYIKDLESYLSYDILSINEDKPYNSDFSFSAKFDKNSTLQWWIEFSQKKIVKSKDLESMDVELNIKAEDPKKNTEPFDLSWSVSLLYKDNEMYAQLHSLDVFMWEGNMVAKMYNLLWDTIIDKRVDLEAHSGWVVEIDENMTQRLPYIMWTLKNVLKSERINENSPNFVNGIAELIETVDSRIDLWISMNELKMVNHEISYSELKDKTIQKEFTWSFQWKDSAFDLSFVASSKWLEIYLYNIKEYNEETSNYENIEKDFKFSIKENKKSEYLVKFESSKLQQKTVNLEWEIKYSDTIKFSADFVTEPIELIKWEKFSWKLEWNITKKAWESDQEIHEITGEIIPLTELLSSL